MSGVRSLGAVDKGKIAHLYIQLINAGEYPTDAISSIAARFGKSREYIHTILHETGVRIRKVRDDSFSDDSAV